MPFTLLEKALSDDTLFSISDFKKFDSPENTVNIGIQTISWGIRIDDLNLLAKQVHELGYQGLEFAQNVDTLGPPDELSKMLEANHLSVVGFAGGALPKRIGYAQQVIPQYLYVDEWDDTYVQEAMDFGSQYGFCVGIHPHRYKSIDSMHEADKYLRQCPQLKLIVDTAHLYLAGDAVLATLKKYHGRTVAVHLKDWTSRFGRSPFRFARGFCELGEGEPELKDILEKTVRYLKETDYQGWVIVEQDTPNGSALDSARISRDWLRKQGL